MMRMMLCEATQSMLVRSAKWSWLKAWAMKIARRRGMKKGSAVRLTARPPERLFHLVFESHAGRASVPIPKRSTSP